MTQLLSLWVSIMSTFATIRVGRAVHDRLTASLLASTFRWLDVTPTSRVIARYSFLLVGYSVSYRDQIQMHRGYSVYRRFPGTVVKLLCCYDGHGSLSSHSHHDICTSVYSAYCHCWSNRRIYRPDLYQGSTFSEARAIKCQGTAVTAFHKTASG